MNRKLKFLACAALIGLGGLISNQEAQGAQAKYFNLSLDAGYSKNHNVLRTTTKSSLSGELGIPLTDFFELGVAHSLTYQKTKLDGPESKEYINAYAAAGRSVSTEENYRSTDTSANASLRWSIGSITPFVFGGKLWRSVCQEDSFQDHGCDGEKPTWNAGIGLSITLTELLRVRAKFTVSPTSSEERNKYDQSTTFGLTWGI